MDWQFLYPFLSISMQGSLPEGCGLPLRLPAFTSSDTATTHIKKLQVAQNRALRIATGCTQITPISCLHRETRILPLKQHMLMRGSHINTSTDCPTHLYTTSEVLLRADKEHVHRAIQSPNSTLPSTHTKQHITPHTLDTYPVNTILGTSPPTSTYKLNHNSTQRRA